MPAADHPHLLIPFAACQGEGWAQGLRALPPPGLRHLGQLLQGMALVHSDNGDAHSLSPPHERALAAALGLLPPGEAVDGLVPLAAWQARDRPDAAGKAWAQVTLCHWAMGREHATMADPAVLGLSGDESRRLLADMQPYFETEGITLHPAAPGVWLAEGEAFRHLPTASLDRVLGRNVDAWLPDARTAPSIRRLQNEMQMLLYTHPLNDERALARRLPVNSIWLSGTGALPASAPRPASAPTVVRSLAQAAFQDDWAAYAQAWMALDAGEVADLLARQRAGETVRLSLCGESGTHTFETAPRGLVARLAGLFKPQRPLAVLEQL